MIVERFSVPRDLAAMNGWYTARGQPQVFGDALPAYGLVVRGVAVGFLYSTDSTIAFADGYVTNPAAPLRERALALRLITRAILSEAKRRGYRTVLGICASPGLGRLVRRLGFRDARRRYEVMMCEV